MYGHWKNVYRWSLLLIILLVVSRFRTFSEVSAFTFAKRALRMQSGPRSMATIAPLTQLTEDETAIKEAGTEKATIIL